jgi:phage terminase large subunit-like protein
MSATRPRPAHGSLTAPGAKPRLADLRPPSWATWRGREEWRRSIRWIQTYCRIPTGHDAGELFRLASFQREIIRALYGNLAAFASLPSANGKTTLLGAVALERICRGDDYAEVDVVATRLGQATEVVTAAARIAEASPEVRVRVALYDEEAELRFRPTGSRLRAQPARLKTLEGLNFNVGIVDEIGFAQDDHVESLLARLGKRPDAHLLGIGTPGFDVNLLWRMRRDAFDGSLPPHTAYLEWAAPEGCDIHDRRAWRTANPALAAGFLNIEALETQAELLPETKFRIYCLGSWVDQSAPWLPPGSWEACPHVEPPPDGADVVLAVEGTYQRTVAIVGADLEGNLFHGWAAERATDAELRRRLDVALERWNVVEVIHSRRIRQRLFRDLEAEGVPVYPWPQAIDVEAGSTNEFYRAIVENRLGHDHDDLLAQHVRDVRVRVLGDGSIRLVRPDTGESVDAAIAARNCWHRALELADLIPAEPPRIY